MTVTLGPISMTDIVRYAGASGDLNPLHHDPEFAARAGYERVVVMGALSGGWAASLRTADRQDGPCTVTVRYRRPVLLGDELSYVPRGDGADVVRRGDGERVTVIEAADTADLAEAPGDPLVPPYEFVVEAGAARDFRRAVIADDDAAGVPPTFPVTVTRWRPGNSSAVRDLGFDYHRMLHARSTFRYAAGPLRVGDRLRVTEYHGPRSVRQRANGDELQVGSVIWNFGDERGVCAQMQYEMVELPKKAPA
jgi:3-hydroxybutyryl-CoA dehydratase